MPSTHEVHAVRRHAPARSRVLGVLATVGLLGVVGGACSTTAELGDPTSGSTPDPCALLTAGDIDRVTGWQLPEGERPVEFEQRGQDVCNWEDEGRSALVQVQVHPGSGRELFEQRREELESVHGMDAADDVEVAGADAAFEQPDHGLVGMLVGTHFVQVVTFGEEPDEAHHLALAALVAGRMS